MKVFAMKQIREAREYSLQGDVALHLHTINSGHPMFKRYPVIAHLLDQNKERLIKTARKLGVRVIKVEREGEPFQHIDLCGKPFQRALAMAEGLKPLVDGSFGEFDWISPSPQPSPAGRGSEE